MCFTSELHSTWVISARLEAPSKIESIPSSFYPSTYSLLRLVPARTCPSAIPLPLFLYASDLFPTVFLHVYVLTQRDYLKGTTVFPSLGLTVGD